jgi:hypothetical protein
MTCTSGAFAIAGGNYARSETRGEAVTLRDVMTCACTWAKGAKTADEATSAITKAIYELGKRHQIKLQRLRDVHLELRKLTLECAILAGDSVQFHAGANIARRTRRFAEEARFQLRLRGAVHALLEGGRYARIPAWLDRGAESLRTERQIHREGWREGPCVSILRRAARQIC